MRDQLGGITESERIAITAVRVAHAHYDIATLAATRGKHSAPPLKEFVPASPGDEPEPPGDFDSWMRALLPLATGRR